MGEELDGTVGRREVIRRLKELAFGRANDCVRLVLEEEPDLDGLDLSLLSGLKRSEKGAVEVKLVDRLRALELLAGNLGAENGNMEEFLRALEGGEED